MLNLDWAPLVGACVIKKDVWEKIQIRAGAAAFVQHFTLIVGMFGGAIAAREGRLLSFSTLSSFFKGSNQWPR